MKYFRLLFILLGMNLLLLTPAQSQDPIFTQFNANQTWQNPAFAGSEGSWRIQGNYRAEVVAIPGAYRSSRLSFDTPIPPQAANKIQYKKGLHSLGVDLVSDRLWEGNTSRYTGNISWSWSRLFPKGNFLSLGLQTGLHSVPPAYVQAGGEMGVDGFWGLYYGPAVAQFQIGSGIVFARENFWISYAVQNLLQESQDLQNLPRDEYRLGRKHQLGAGLKLLLGGYSDKIRALFPGIQVEYQASRLNLRASTSFQNPKWAITPTFSHTRFVGYDYGPIKNNSAGLFGSFRYRIVQVHLGYDYQFSRFINSVSGGSWELGLQFQLDWKKESAAPGIWTRPWSLQPASLFRTQPIPLQ